MQLYFALFCLFAFRYSMRNAMKNRICRSTLLYVLWIYRMRPFVPQEDIRYGETKCPSSISSYPSIQYTECNEASHQSLNANDKQRINLFSSFYFRFVRVLFWSCSGVLWKNGLFSKNSKTNTLEEEKKVTSYSKMKRRKKQKKV